MKNVIHILLLIIVSVRCPSAVVAHRGRTPARGSPSGKQPGSSLLYIASPSNVWTPRGRNDLRRRVTLSSGVRRTGRATIHALNPEKAELHPESLSNVEPTISDDRIDELKRKGFIQGDSRTWRNWHIVTQGMRILHALYILQASGTTLENGLFPSQSHATTLQSRMRCANRLSTGASCEAWYVHVY